MRFQCELNLLSFHVQLVSDRSLFVESPMRRTEHGSQKTSALKTLNLNPKFKNHTSNELQNTILFECSFLDIVSIFYFFFLLSSQLIVD